VASTDRIAHRGQAITRGVTNQHDATDPKRIFKHKYNVRFRNRPHRDETDRTLHPRIDGVARLENIPEHDLGDGSDRSTLEIQIEAASAPSSAAPRLRARRAGVRYFGALEYGRLRPRTA